MPVPNGFAPDAMAEAATVGYQGEPGAFSEEAATLLFPGVETVPHRGLRSIFDDVEGGALTHGVVPLENSQAGSINETYDLLAGRKVSIVAEVILGVDHALLALRGTGLAGVRRVLSHPQALAQCQEFLAELDAEVVPVYDTAGAAKRIADDRRAGEAAVASERAAALYGLEVLASRIQTYRENQTRFAAIAGTPEPLGPPDRTSLLLEVRDVPGALYRCLRPFAERNLNLSKLESRPLGPNPWKYRFYLDVDAGLDEPDLQEALVDLEPEVSGIYVLGSYPRWRET